MNIHIYINKRGHGLWTKGVIFWSKYLVSSFSKTSGLLTDRYMELYLYKIFYGTYPLIRQ